MVALSARVVNELRSHRAQQAEELLALGVPLSDGTFVIAQVDGSPLQARCEQVVAAHLLP
jgi:hypothetical protein